MTERNAESTPRQRRSPTDYLGFLADFNNLLWQAIQ